MRIETGIDRLVALVNKEKKISIDAAAKKLGVLKNVVQEWADFLEEEGLLSIEYHLSKTFLTERKLSKKELEKKKKEYESKKEAFTRKVETTLQKLEKETAGFEEIKKQYYALKEEIGDEIEQVKDEMEDLLHYEDLKKSIDRDIIQQKMDYENALNSIRRRIMAEERRYEQIMEKVDSEQKTIDDEKREFEQLRKEEESLAKRLDALQELASSLKEQLKARDKEVASHEERLVTLKELAEALEKEIKEKRRKELEPIIKSAKDHEEKIISVQNSIIKKIVDSKKRMKDFKGQGDKISGRFKKFFEKRSRTERLITSLEKEKAEMERELKELIMKAKSFDLATKGANMDKHIKELTNKFNDFDKRRSAFAKKLKELRTLISGK